MTLVDTSVWIDHLRRGNDELISLLERNEVYGHVDVTGELACGQLRQRARILELLHQLPAADSWPSAQVLRLIEQEKLWGRGLGWTDVRLLAAALEASARLWTLDRALNDAARELGLS